MKAAWKDAEDEIPDEEGLKFRKVKLTAKRDSKYESRLVDQFELVHGPTPSWAQLKRKKRKAEDEDESIPDEKKPDSDYQSRSLKRGNIKIFRVLDLNSASRETGAIVRSVKFHPKSQVGLVAGGSAVALYQVDGVNNTKIQSVDFEKFPLRNACFSAGGEEILVSSGLMGHFYSYDMISGDISKAKPNRLTEKETVRNLVPSPDGKILVGLGHHGNMYLFSSRSKEVIDTLTMNGEVTGVTFNSDGSRMYSCGVQGEIYMWDINRRLCVDKYADHGTVSSTAIAVSNSFLATGSNAGVVNVYRNSCSSSSLKPGAPRQPEKSIMNLVTPISALEFNKQEEMLVMTSKDKNNAIKMAHLPSLTVFANFPAFDADWGRPNCIAFSPNSGYFSMGNNKGSAFLFRLNHYENY